MFGFPFFALEVEEIYRVGFREKNGWAILRICNFSEMAEIVVRTAPSIEKVMSSIEFDYDSPVMVCVVCPHQ
jgi:hypothetical protein